MLPQLNRLKKSKEFQRVFRQGKGFKENFLFLKTAPNSLKNSRFGFVVSKNLSRKASTRNKIKRRLRELIRAKLEKIKPGRDCVLVAHAGLENMDFWEIEGAINNLFQRAGLI